MSAQVDVLGLLDRAQSAMDYTQAAREAAQSCGVLPGDFRHLRTAIAELIAADREYDDARARLNVPMPNGEVDAALDKLEAATARRASALAAVGGSK